MTKEKNIMKIRIDRKNIDLNRFPYRGILSEIARERGVTRQAVQQSASKRNLETLELIAEKVKKRMERVNRYKRSEV